MKSSLASKDQDIKLKGLQFHFIKEPITGIHASNSCHFEASEDIMTKIKSKALDDGDILLLSKALFQAY